MSDVMNAALQLAEAMSRIHLSDIPIYFVCVLPLRYALPVARYKASSPAERLAA